MEGGSDGDRPGRFALISEGGEASGEGSKASSSSSSFFAKDGYVKTNLTKWDILRGTTYKKFRYDKFYHKQDAEAFVKDLLASPEVLREIIAGGSGGDDLEVASFSCRAVRATVTSMAFFDKLLGESGIVRSNGLLVKCMDDYYEGFHVQDRLREILLNEDNEYELDHGEVFGEEDKGELLFKIFRHLCVGGSLCQFEDSLDPYLEVAKAVYKELLTVWRNPKSGKAEVASGAYEVGDVKLRRRQRCEEEEGAGMTTTVVAVVMVVVMVMPRRMRRRSGTTSKSGRRRTGSTSPPTPFEGRARCGFTGSSTTGEGLSLIDVIGNI